MEYEYKTDAKRIIQLLEQLIQLQKENLEKLDKIYRYK